MTNVYIGVEWGAGSGWGFFSVLLVIFTCGYCQKEDKSKLLQLIWNIVSFLAEAKSNNILLADYDMGPCCLLKNTSYLSESPFYSRTLKLLVGFEIS